MFQFGRVSSFLLLERRFIPRKRASLTMYKRGTLTMFVCIWFMMRNIYAGEKYVMINMHI